jgi:glycosyltransferase involved in cell wall biosynthesis
MSSTISIEGQSPEEAAAAGPPIHILILTDRDWEHPQGGGTGTHLHEQVKHWLAWGHKVTVIAGGFDGALPVERQGNLTVKRIGSRTTVFPRSIVRGRAALESKADVAFEVINGITFLTPIWMDIPRVGMIHHIHREHYVREMGSPGRIAAAALETLPLKLFYRDTTFMTVSESTAGEIATHGIPRSRIHVAHNGVESDHLSPGVRSKTPKIVYLGRIKRYKRIELLVEALAQIPGVVLEIAGDGDHRPEVEEAIAKFGVSDRVRLHGFVSEEQKLELLQSSWLNVTASSVEGWSLVAMEAAACATPTVAMRVGGLREAVVDGTTGLLADNPSELTAYIRRLLENDDERERMAQAGLERSWNFNWERTAALTIGVLRGAISSSKKTAVKA